MNFDKRVKRFERQYTFNWLFIWIVTAIIFVVLIWGGYTIVKVVKKVDEHGLKNVIERVWEGEK